MNKIVVQCLQYALDNLNTSDDKSADSMILGYRFPTAAFSFSKRLKTEMKKRLVNVKEIFKQ